MRRTPPQAQAGNRSNSTNRPLRRKLISTPPGMVSSDSVLTATEEKHLGPTEEELRLSISVYFVRSLKYPPRSTWSQIGGLLPRIVL